MGFTRATGGRCCGTYRYKLDSSDLSTGAAVTTNTSFRSPKDLSYAIHTLYVQEKDDVGNWSPSGSLAISVENCSNFVSWGQNLYGQLGNNANLMQFHTDDRCP